MSGTLLPPIEAHVLVRSASVYLAVATTAAIVVARPPGRRTWVGVLLACAWGLPALLMANVVAVGAGWWSFDAEGGTLLGIPVDLLLAWVWLWAAIPRLAAPHAPLPVLVAAALAVDLVVMPAAAPVVQLGPAWLWGEALCLVAAFVPAQLLARWTVGQTHLFARATLQALAFAALVAFVLPAMAIEGSGAGWRPPLDRPRWQVLLWLQVLALPAVMGLSAVHEFATRGGGTPVPFDPPARLVTSGLYAFVRNPMQISALLLLALLGIALGNVWIGLAAVMAHLYGAGLAAWDEADDMPARHGATWTAYVAAVPSWWPRWRPWWPADAPPARLYVAGSCDMCRQVGAWISARRPEHLRIVAAESHPSAALVRVTYESAGGDYSAEGIVALARALEHIHVAWALVGCLLRLPGLAPLLQLLVDASGGGPRTLRDEPCAVELSAASAPVPWSRPRRATGVRHARAAARAPLGLTRSRSRGPAPR